MNKVAKIIYNDLSLANTSIITQHRREANNVWQDIEKLHYVCYSCFNFLLNFDLCFGKVVNWPNHWAKTRHTYWNRVQYEWKDFHPVNIHEKTAICGKLFIHNTAIFYSMRWCTVYQIQIPTKKIDFSFNVYSNLNHAV